MATTTAFPPPPTTSRVPPSSFPASREPGVVPSLSVLTSSPAKPKRARSQPQQQQHDNLTLPSRHSTGDLLPSTQPNQVGSPQDDSSGSSSGGLTDARIAADRSLREYIDLLRRRRQASQYNAEPGLDEQLRIRAALALGDLSVLRRRVIVMAQEAKGRKWRRWLVGGLIGSVIPAVKAVFNRPSKSDADKGSTLGRTEYAFRESRRFLRRFVDAARGRGGLASLAFIVFSVLYIFQNEVILRVAKTVSKRLRRLGSKIKMGWEEVEEADISVLEGWRWRILNWES